MDGFLNVRPKLRIKNHPLMKTSEIFIQNGMESYAPNVDPRCKSRWICQTLSWAADHFSAMAILNFGWPVSVIPHGFANRARITSPACGSMVRT